MNNEYKDVIHKNAKSHIKDIQEKVKTEIKNITELNAKQLKQVSKEDQPIFIKIKLSLDKRLEELAILYGSPYFIKCKIKFEDSNIIEDAYFGKFEFIDNSIYSWVTPIASIRFENIGHVSYRLPDGKTRCLQLLSKEQFMIVDGEIIFQTIESLQHPRELIYQKHFSERKKGFILPEIVAQMEKAQDQVIRAHYKGPFVISGPAGSGKTTLAFHRIAYLVQSPDTTDKYPTQSIIIFVQDKNAVDYFSHLLPELGINNVNITSFDEWAMKVIGIKDTYLLSDYTEIEINNVTYEQEKLNVLRKQNIPEFSKAHFKSLDIFYSKHLSKDNYSNFKKQKSKKILDRFDLIFLLNSYIKKNGNIKLRGKKDKLLYSMILVDEFQNYLPEQLKIIKNLINNETESIIYVGDMKQQINFGTIKGWGQINEKIIDDRNIVLSKVYRNTKKILTYINDLGFSVDIPEGLKEGSDVKEEIFINPEDQVSYVRKIIEENEGVTIGIIAENSSDLKKFLHLSIERENVHIINMAKSQSLEFDIVIIVDIDKLIEKQKNNETLAPEFLNEKKAILKDLLYVALTRAINELHVIGATSLKEQMR